MRKINVTQACFVVVCMATSGCGPMIGSPEYMLQHASQQRELVASQPESQSLLDEIHNGRPGDDAFKQVDAYLVSHLLDPESRKIRGFRVVQGSIVCAEVNSKNTYGGYTGFEPLIAVFTTDGRLKSAHIVSQAEIYALDTNLDQTRFTYAEHQLLYECGEIRF
jgi:hypothetical protein